MADLIRRRRPDGVTQLFPRDARFGRAEWTMASFTTLLFANVLFLSTAIPIQLVGLVVLAWAAGEACYAIRTLRLMRRPPAEVRELAPAHAQRRAR
jgi:hypothetical protein